MRVTIKGLTQSTISFTTLGIILRGTVEARSIDLKNDAQIREVNSICNAGLIEIINEDPIVISKPVIVPVASKTNVIWKTLEHKVSAPTPAPIVEKPAPAKVVEKTEAKRSRGRPKGAKNKIAAKGKKSEVKTEVTKVVPKPIKKLDPVAMSKSTPSDDIEDKIVVMTANGAVSGHMVKSYTGDMPECEATEASIQAMRDIEAEEKADREAEEVVEDQSGLDASERTGGKAVIATGDRQATHVEMKNSVLPEAEAIRKAPKFIDLPKAEDNSEDAFIDKTDDKDDFLEV